jgi:hypothetical protein
MAIFLNHGDKIDTTLYIGCDCHDPSHAVKLTKFHDDDLLEDTIYLSYLHQNLDLLGRLRLAWDLIWNNSIDLNEIVLKRETWTELADVLNKIKNQ